jgi:hypothetical protein
MNSESCNSGRSYIGYVIRISQAPNLHLCIRSYVQSAACKVASSELKIDSRSGLTLGLLYTLVFLCRWCLSAAKIWTARSSTLTRSCRGPRPTSKSFTQVWKLKKNVFDLKSLILFHNIQPHIHVPWRDSISWPITPPAETIQIDLAALLRHYILNYNDYIQPIFWWKLARF